MPTPKHLFTLLRRHRTPSLSPSSVEIDGPFQHALVHARGLRFHVAQAGSPKDPLVLLIHGSFGGWFDYRYVIAPIARAGYHSVAVDMRGFGMSDKPPTDFGYDMRGAVGDIMGIISALGHHKAVLVGSDSGAAVAWCAAVSQPERVSALISAPGSHPSDLRRVMARHPARFLWGIGRAGVSRTPLSRLRRHLYQDQHLYRRELLSTTAARFHDTPEFEESLTLRITAARIGGTHYGIKYNHQLVTATVPVRWAHGSVPLSLIHI